MINYNESTKVNYRLIGGAFLSFKNMFIYKLYKYKDYRITNRNISVFL